MLGHNFIQVLHFGPLVIWVWHPFYSFGFFPPPGATTVNLPAKFPLCVSRTPASCCSRSCSPWTSSLDSNCLVTTSDCQTVSSSIIIVSENVQSVKHDSDVIMKFQSRKKQDLFWSCRDSQTKRIWVCLCWYCCSSCSLFMWLIKAEGLLFHNILYDLDSWTSFSVEAYQAQEWHGVTPLIWNNNLKNHGKGTCIYFPIKFTKLTFFKISYSGIYLFRLFIIPRIYRYLF